MKLLTIVIPTYNTELYIERCLSSILNEETAKYIEVLVVNDGSRDNSVKIAKTFEEKFPKSVRIIDKENGGHGSTINRGLLEATGKYFRVLDSDDWYDTPNFINFIKVLEKCDEDVIAVPYTEEHTYIPNSVLFGFSSLDTEKTLKFDDIKTDNIENVYFPMASATYKTELLRKSGLLLFEKTFYVDMQFNIFPIPYIETVRYLKEPVYRYFIGRPTQSMSQENLTRNYTNHEKVLKFVIEYYTEHEKTASAVKKEYMRYIASCMCFTFFNTVCIKLKNKKTSYKVIKEFDEYLRNTNHELYNYTSNFGYLRYSRKLGFKNVYFMNLFVKLIDIARKVRSR